MGEFFAIKQKMFCPFEQFTKTCYKCGQTKYSGNLISSGGNLISKTSIGSRNPDQNAVFNQGNGNLKFTSINFEV